MSTTKSKRNHRSACLSTLEDLNGNHPRTVRHMNEIIWSYPTTRPQDNTAKDNP